MIDKVNNLLKLKFTNIINKKVYNLIHDICISTDIDFKNYNLLFENKKKYLKFNIVK